jgi:hypothetical protein
MKQGENNIYTMNKIINLVQTRTDLIKDFRRIPDWIETTSNIDYQIWNVMFKCNLIIMDLITSSIKRQKTINNMVNEFMLNLQYILPSMSEVKQIRLAIYYATLLETAGTKCLDDEQYEACQNIKSFGDVYFKINYVDEQE